MCGAQWAHKFLVTGATKNRDCSRSREACENVSAEKSPSAPVTAGAGMLLWDSESTAKVDGIWSSLNMQGRK